MERQLRTAIQLEIDRLAASGQYSRKVLGVLQEKTPTLVKWAAQQTEPVPIEAIPKAVEDHAAWLLAYTRHARLTMQWEAIRRLLMYLRPCCTKRPGGWPFCNPKC